MGNKTSRSIDGFNSLSDFTFNSIILLSEKHPEQMKEAFMRLINIKVKTKKDFNKWDRACMLMLNTPPLCNNRNEYTKLYLNKLYFYNSSNLHSL